MADEATNQEDIIESTITKEEEGKEDEEKEDEIKEEEEEQKTVENDEEMERKCQEIISSLDEEELEKAARCSYRYFIGSTTDRLPTPSKEERNAQAMAMAYRYLVVTYGNTKKALKMVKATIRYRDEFGVDDIRRSFDPDIVNNTENMSEEDVKKYAEIRDNVHLAIKNGMSFARGCDMEGRPLHIVVSRDIPDEWDRNWFVKSQTFIMEKCMACCERRALEKAQKQNSSNNNNNGIDITSLPSSSSIKQPRSVAFFDYNGFQLRHNPPLAFNKDLLFCLRDHNPQRLLNVYLIDTPLIYRVVWTLCSPFIDSITKKTIVFVTGEEAKKKILGTRISKEQAMPFMMSGGALEEPLDVHKFLYDIPFDQVYDEDLQ